MGSPTCLADPGARVVLDASAIINLNASGFAPSILGALPNRAVVVDAIPVELQQGHRRGRRDAEQLTELVGAGLIELVRLGTTGESLFESLVIGAAAETLDDGEAATIAYAAELSAIAIIDERKAIRICGQRLPELRLGSTVDLFAHPDVLRALGPASLSKAVLNALHFARMRVLPHHLDWVIELVGPEQAAQCGSLPRRARMTGADASGVAS